MTAGSVSFSARSTSSDLMLAASIDQLIICNQSLQNQFQQFRCDFDDVFGAHLLTFSMSGKLPHHTELDKHGIIVSDHVIEIDNVAIDDMLLAHVFYNQASYQHNFNGHGHLQHEAFHGVMGCNGTVTLNFTTPLYVWLLKNL